MLKNYLDLPQLWKSHCVQLVNVSPKTLRCIDIGAHPEFKLGINDKGYPAIIICSFDDGPSIEYERNLLNVSFNKRMSLDSGDNVFESKGILIECKSISGDTGQVFFATLSNMISKFINQKSSFEQIKSDIEELLKIYEEMRDLSHASAIGLWGELYLILNSKDPKMWGDSYHQNTNDRYDFSFESFSLEIKTTELQRRVHSFSYRQLADPSGKLYIGSIMINASSGGQSLLELINDSRFFGLDCKSLNKARLKILNYTENNQSSIRKKYELANPEKGILFYDSVMIPRPNINSSAILEVSFKVDMDQCSASNDLSYPF